MTANQITVATGEAATAAPTSSHPVSYPTTPTAKLVNAADVTLMSMNTTPRKVVPRARSVTGPQPGHPGLWKPTTEAVEKWNKYTAPEPLAWLSRASHELPNALSLLKVPGPSSSYENF
ncbi:hypothetical protein HK102_002604 [Quaeritorhiza haematococci]|nr:hypothetical protein HK102_002604 [Quaeritorhiza haematococci]